MDQRAYDERKSLFGEDSSLGTSNWDKFRCNGKFFGDIYDSFKNKSSEIGSESDRPINDRLNTERVKALEALKKSQDANVFKRPYSVCNKENSKCSINVSSNNPSMQFDNTDYVPFRRPNAINISDLVTDETINLESISSCSTSKDNIKVSFEPSEITGRSTLYNRDSKHHYDNAVVGVNVAKQDSLQTMRMSVGDILASSFAPKARNLCENLQGDTASKSNESNTSFTNSLSGRNLPRSADFSLSSKSSSTDESFNRCFDIASFGSAGAGAGLDESEMFAPGELMQSKLISDEISWAQEYAAIPTATLSQQARVKLLSNTGPNSNSFETPSTSNSMIAGDPNFSVGNFFNLRSDNIWNIVRTTSPDKCRTPVALVEEDDNTMTVKSDLESSSKISITPKIDNKTYTRVESLATPLETEISLPKDNTPHYSRESKDSGNSSDNMSYLLSISAIDRALCNLDIHSNTSGIGVSEQLLMEVKNAKFSLGSSKDSKIAKSNRVSLETPANQINSVIDKNAIEKMILENKENLDPCRKHSPRASAFDGNFEESLLDSSRMKNLQHSITQPRSPLSPINLTPAIRIDDPADNGVEVNTDNWPSTPISNNRRISRTKSPGDKEPLKTNVNINDSQDGTTPVNLRPSHGCDINKQIRLEKESKSLSSTRVDGAVNNTKVDLNFEMSPNLLTEKHVLSSLAVHSYTLNAPQMRSPNNASPSRSTNSPMSSPSVEFHSPNLDVTSNSDCQLLSAAVSRKVISSPVGSEASSTCGYSSYGGAIATASGRSVSRCSTTSEFSLRDGKQIPLKVTNKQLSWASIKLRTETRKSMQIKNIINKRVVLRVEASGPGFQIVNSQRSSNTMTLHSQECRTITVSFCPTICGVAIGKLSFYAPNGAATIDNSFLDIPLFGYGGNASIIARNILIGPVGAPFVSMGDICELGQPLERTISFYNKGPLLGFASVTVDSIGLMIPRLSDEFEISPRQILIPPKTMVNFHVVFRPKREEVRKIIKKMGGVLTLANLRVICGDEVNRQRIRRLLPQMSEEERSKLKSSSLDLVFSQFPHEMEVTDLVNIKENPSTVMDLITYFRIHEILLTINHENIDDTFEASSLFVDDADETVLFRTICAANDSPTPSTHLNTVDEDDEYNDEVVSKDTKQNSWSVSPETLEIDLKRNEPITLRVHNGFKSRQFFEVACNSKDLLQFTPSDGYLLADGGETKINICLQDNFKYPTERVFIMVYMENERIMIPVNIIK